MPLTALAQDEEPDEIEKSEEITMEEEEPQARIYTTREERRDAGLKHRITDWLTFSGLGEIEAIGWRYGHFEDSDRTDEDEFTKTVQLALEATPWEWAKAEVITEYDDEFNKFVLDEAIASVEVGDFEFEGGDLFVPFGEYFSHFVSGPYLEFGETRGHGFIVSYGPSDRLDIAAFAYNGSAQMLDSGSGDWSWGAIVEGSPFEFLTLSLSYLSDLADSEEALLEDEDNFYEKRVDALSGYAVVGLGRLEFTGEFVRALDSFEELDEDRDRPSAWNLELAYFPDGNISWALRLEGTRELEDAPELLGGIAATWRITDHIYLTAEYLRGHFREGLAETDDEILLDSIQQVGAILSIEF